MLTFRSQQRVEFSDTDAAGLAHFSMFYLYMERTEHEFLRSRGLSVIMRDEHGVISWPRVSTKCEFRSAIKFEDVVDVELRVDRLGDKSVRYGFTFTHEGRLVAEGEIVAVCCRMNPHGPPQSMTIPAMIRDKLADDV